MLIFILHVLTSYFHRWSCDPSGLCQLYWKLRFLFILNLNFHLLQKSSNLQRRVFKPLAVLDKSIKASAYIRQDICKPKLPRGIESPWSSKHFDKSFRYSEKTVALGTQPCLTPILVSKELLNISVFMECINYWYISSTIFQKWAFDIVFTHFMKELVPINWWYQMPYCRANQEWQWRRVLFTLISKTLNYTLHLSSCESIDHLCINPILWIGLIHKWSIDSKSLITL